MHYPTAPPIEYIFFYYILYHIFFDLSIGQNDNRPLFWRPEIVYSGELVIGSSELFFVISIGRALLAYCRKRCFTVRKLLHSLKGTPILKCDWLLRFS